MFLACFFSLELARLAHWQDKVHGAKANGAHSVSSPPCQIATLANDLERLLTTLPTGEAHAFRFSASPTNLRQESVGWQRLASALSAPLFRVPS